MTALLLCPVTLDESNEMVRRHHRHHGPVVGHLAAIGAVWGDLLVGVVLVGRPVARHLDDGWTAEVTRLCLDTGTLDAAAEGYVAAAWWTGREAGGRGLAHADSPLRALARAPMRQAASLLYGAAWRSAQAMGRRRIVTYTLPAEGGASLRASGWCEVGPAGGGSWDTPSRRRTDKSPTDTKTRWECVAADYDAVRCLPKRRLVRKASPQGTLFEED